MILSHDKLVEKLAELLGREEEWVAAELYKMIEEIKEATANGAEYKIEKFGTFCVRDEKLVFTADDTFALEINYKYAGMLPVAADSSNEKVDHDVSHNEIDSESPSDEESEKKDDGSTKEKVLPFQNDSPLDKLLRKPVKSDPESEGKIDVSKGPHQTKEAVQKSKSSGIQKETVRKKGLKKKKISANKKAPGKKKVMNGTIISVGIIVMICLFAAGVATLIETNAPIFEKAYRKEHAMPPNPTSPGGTSHINAGQNTPAKQNQKQTSPQSVSQSNNSNLTNNTRKNSDVKQTKKILSELSASNLYGLKGKIKPTVHNFFTIVVYSLINQDQADSQRSKLDKRGFRTVVTKADVNGTIVWRVGLGQFPSVNDAENAAGKLPAPFNTKHFIKRIQIQ